MRVLISIISILFISFNLYAKQTNIGCSCLDAEYKNAGDKFFTNVSCSGVDNRLTEDFTATIHYSNNDITHSTSSLTFSTQGIIYSEYSHEVTFDFVWSYFWEKMEKWSYVFYRLKVNKFNLDYELTSFNRDLTDEDKFFSLVKGNPGYYLDDLFKDKEENTTLNVKGSCKLSEKKL